MNEIEAQSTQRRPWWRAFIITSIVFVSGAIVGGTLVTYVLWQRQVEAAQEPKFQGQRIIQQLDRKFDLREEQRVAVEVTVRRHHEALEEIRLETEPRVRAVFESMHQEIANVLHPEQTEYWERRIDSMNERWLRHRRTPEGGRPRHEGQRRRPPMPPEFIRAVDRDGDRLFSFEELSHAFPEMDERRYGRMDQDGDGLVSPDEFAETRRMRPERRPEHRRN